MANPSPARAPGTDHCDVLARVRTATRNQHACLDAGLAVAGAHAGLAEYRAHLSLLWRWLAPMQAWLDVHEDGPQDPRLLPRSPRLHWLRADLDELDGGLPATGAAAPAWPLPASAAFRWGACYVVEGSALGGRVLLQRLAPRLGSHRPRLLAGGGDAAQSQRWQSFTRTLRREVTTPEAIAAACAGAQTAFARLLELAGLPAHAQQSEAAA